MLKQYKSDVCPQYLYHASAFIVQQIESHPRFVTANRISIFNALPDEPSTFELIKRWCDSKEIYLPVITGGVIQLARYSSDSCTRTGLYNIIEPVTDEYFTDYASLDLILVPGVAFDETGNRLGRGRGYYDELITFLHKGMNEKFLRKEHLDTFLVASTPEEALELALNTPQWDINVRRNAKL